VLLDSVGSEGEPGLARSTSSLKAGESGIPPLAH
jgi:hypothetical protein